MTGKVMTARKKAFQPLPPSPQEQSAVLIMNRQPRSILEKYSRDQVRQLYEFLHNGNPPYRYVFGFRSKSSTEPIYKNADRFKRLPVSKSIDWAIRTLGGIDQLERRHCYVPLPNNPSGMSRWGGLDFDAHEEGQLAAASALAIGAFLHVVNEPLFTVLETSGVGFKLWMIANEFRAVSWWATFLERIVCAIGARPQSGVVELFPAANPKSMAGDSEHLEHGIRATTSSTGSCSMTLTNCSLPLKHQKQ